MNTVINLEIISDVNQICTITDIARQYKNGDESTYIGTIQFESALTTRFFIFYRNIKFLIQNWPLCWSAPFRKTGKQDSRSSVLHSYVLQTLQHQITYATCHYRFRVTASFRYNMRIVKTELSNQNKLILLYPMDKIYAWWWSGRI